MFCQKCLVIRKSETVKLSLLAFFSNCFSLNGLVSRTQWLGGHFAFHVSRHLRANDILVLHRTTEFFTDDFSHIEVVIFDLRQLSSQVH